ENKAKIEKLQTEYDLLMKYETIMEKHQKAEQQLVLALSRYENSLAKWTDAKALVEELEKKWRHGQAVLLAASLTSGEPCPVCGSEHHPSPTLSQNGEIPNEEDLKASKEQVQKWEQEKSKDESSYFQSKADEKAKLDALSESFIEIKTIRPDFSKDQLFLLKAETLSAKDGLLDKQAELKEQMELVDQVIVQIEKYESEKMNLQNQIQDVIEKITELTIQVTEKGTNLNRMMKMIPENLRTESEYERELTAAQNLQQNLVKRLEDSQKKVNDVKEKLAAVVARLQDAEAFLLTKQQELATERETFKNKLAEQGFENYTEYHAGKLTESDIKELESQIRNYREELRSVSDRLTELTERLANIPTPDIASLKLELENITNEIHTLSQERTDLVIKKKNNEEVQQQIERLNEVVKELEERYSLIGHLYRIAKGDNSFKVTFERFVLAAFLDDILREANGRLRKMTSGRFQLRRKTDRSKGNAQSGLELLVYDQYTGQERHVKTLSGGESFKASLSLALGLADVVQQYAGGVSLETMFIDEGFGTLDPESLDQAIESLMDIQNSGRLVGIISHVPELKERIDARLEVISGQTGSRTEFVFTN
ncbi:SbcC/MukB-like Walker B domain-containing protein, partial [Bacillus sp. JJ1764]|uniref:SbcC/MukB-like Walker B domain-containing protein n=1 Tax=Bacillus sp. JJ1764 TaxID=3122964 RepID=UPI00300087FD